MNKTRNFTGRAKKAAGSLVLLLVFLLPLYLSATWIYGITGGLDTRSVYSSQEIADFRDKSEPDESGDLRPFDEPIVSVTFDDGWESIYSEAFPLLEKYNIRSTQYILGGLFSDKAYLSDKQVGSMKDAGHEIAAHTMTHEDLTALDSEDLEWELGECDRVLSGKFGEIGDFATPLGASNATVLNSLKKYYRSHRNTVGDAESMEDSDINVRENFNIYNINAFTVRRTTTIDEIQRYLDYTAKRKGWAVITYHQVDANDASEYAVSPEVLESHLKLIRERKVRTATVGQVLDTIERNK